MREESRSKKMAQVRTKLGEVFLNSSSKMIFCYSREHDSRKTDTSNE